MNQVLSTSSAIGYSNQSISMLHQIMVTQKASGSTVRVIISTEAAHWHRILCCPLANIFIHSAPSLSAHKLSNLDSMRTRVFDAHPKQFSALLRTKAQIGRA